MIEKRLVRFPNESEFIQTEININDFDMVSIYKDEMFGWYKNMYISIKIDGTSNNLYL